MAASVSQNGRFRAVFLSVIMILMTQVGYTENMDFSIGLDQDTESKDTGSSTPALTPSVEGADLMVGDLMDDITFQHETGTYNGNGTAWMVKDINTGSSYGSTPSLSHPIVLGNMMYFSVDDGTNGKELWKSDGTEAGTVMVKDIWSGSDGGSMLGSWQATIGNTLYFPARDGISSTASGIAELWKTDGTASGTVLVKDIRTGSIGSDPSWLTPVGNTLYFSAWDSSGSELWKSDGTEAGTVMVKNIYNITATGGSVPQYLTAIGNTLYFTADDGINGNELWKSDGTEAGTVMVKDINSGSGNSNSKYLIAIGNSLYFQADDGNNGYELWKSDGTASGTMMVKDINSGSSSGISLNACDMYFKIEFNNMLYFRADDGTNGCELWKSDGTANGTVMVKDIYQSVSGEGYPQYFTANGDAFYFKANDGNHGYELWKSDGTASGTVMVKDINNGSGNSDILKITPLGDTVYFYGNDGTSGAELWKSDGTEAGTVMVQDINSGSSSSWPVYLTPLGNTLYFAADGGTGRELWALDPANITGLSSGSGSSTTNFIGANCTVSPALPTGLNIDSSTCTISGTPSVGTSNTTYTVTTNISGTTYQGTVWLATMTFGTITSPVMGAELDLSEAMTPITLNYTSQAGNATVYNGNGTAWMVRDINTGTSNNGGSMSAMYLEQDAVMGNEMYFFATDSTNGYELWKSDGTESGTVMVKDINNGSGSSMPSSNSALSVNSNLHLKAMNNTNTLFFVANDGIHGEELWKTDGTASGTVMVKDINSANGNSGHSEIGEFTQMGSTLYFRADDGTNGQELWKTDGTSSGTVMVKDINPGNAGVVDCDCLRAITVVGNTLYFTADDGTHGEELWKSDGTTAGTVMVKNIGTGGLGAEGSGIEHISVAGNYIYFAAKPTLSVTSLFRSDGTAAGTVVIKPNDFIWTKPTITIGSTLFFVGGSTYNATIWKSNGTSSGTTMAVDVLPQTNTLHTLGADTYGIGGKRCDRNVGNSFYFMARDHAAGGGLDTRYLWKSDGTASGTVQVKDVNNANVTGGRSTCGIIGDTLFFVKQETRQLWKTNGTPSGTKMIIDMDSLSPSGYGELSWNFASINNKLYFGAGDGTNGIELWAYNPTNLTLNTPPPVSWETYPALPAGMSISNGVISGTPSVYAVNQTYTIYANQSGQTTTFGMYFSVGANNPHTVVENQPIDPIGFHGPFQNGTTTWTVSPALPADLVMDPNTGEITGSVNGVLANTTYTVTATHGSSGSGSGGGSGSGSGSGGSTGTGATETFTFSLQSLADLDGDGLPNDLPSDYDAAQGPTPGLVADTDDDADGLDDAVETDTGEYVDANDTGTDPLDPDTDDDGICDGPNAVPPICIAGPDPTLNGDDGPPTLVALNNTAISGLAAYKALPGGTYEIMPDLPQSLTMDPNTGIISGTPTQTLDNTTFTAWVNLSDGTSLSWNFTIEIPEDSDGDGLPDELPDDYDPSNPASPGLVEDLDDDNDGVSDLEEEAGGTDSTNPDNDGDGMCDGPVAVDPDCVAGPDAFPLDPSADTDTDGDGDPDTITGNSTSVPPLEEDMDDDGDGLSDLAETGTGVYNGTSDYGTDSLNPDTDGDGVCDGPNSVWPICINGPDSNPFGTHDGGNIVLVENVEIDTPIPPPNQVPGAVWEISPALPAGLTLDTSSGEITGTATEVSDNTTYTLWANVSDFGRSDSVALSVMATFGLTVLEDSDGDGMPDELPDDYDPNIGALVEDLDDDNDGMLDTEEDTLGTDPTNPDTDGDGFCDGPADVYAADGTLVCRGPDSAPLDSALPVDTDGDMFPDEDPDGPGGLEADTDDDNDGFSDEEENNCGSNRLDANDLPSDFDGDTICDMVDADDDGDGLNDTVETNTGIYISSEDSGSDPLNPDTDGDGYCDGPVSPNYSNCTAGPDAFPTDASAHLDSDGDGDPDTITGNSTTGLVEDLDDDGDGASDLAEGDCGTDPLDASDTPDTDSDGNCVEKQASAESLFEWSWSWCFCLIFLLLLLLLIPIVLQRDRILVMVGTGPEPENTVSEPEFMEGAGTLEDPFILEPLKKIKAGESISTKEVITIDKMTVNNVEMIDLNQEDNGDKFSMYETGFDEIGVRLIKVGDDGEITINMHFDDSVGGATYAGGEFTGLLKLGSASVYLSWTVNVKPDKKKLKEIEKAEKEAKKAEEEAAAKEAEEKAAREAEEAEAKKKAEEEAAAAAKEAEEEEAAAAAALLAKEEEEKAAKEAEEKAAKKKAEAEAKKAKEAEEAEAKKKAKEEAAAKKKAEAEAKKAKEAEEKAAKEAEEKAAKEAEEAEAKKKAEAEAEKKAKKPASPKEAKKQEELQRVKERAKTIDFKVIGKASSTKLKSEVKKGAKTLEVADASEFADSGSAQIADEEGSSVIAWTGKDGNTLTGLSGVKRVFGAASIVVVKDDLQVIKGVGPFIEEKLNALGITTYRQIANMNAKLEKQVNEAIEFFPGRVARDQWVAQAKILLGENVKLDEKALKQAEELARVAAKAEKIDFGTIGVASATDKDNLQELKGIGPFIEEKLNALGIFKFEQIAKMTSKIEDEVNIAIEFFPGRVKRDEWVKQAKERTK